MAKNKVKRSIHFYKSDLVAKQGMDLKVIEGLHHDFIGKAFKFISELDFKEDSTNVDSIYMNSSDDSLIYLDLFNETDDFIEGCLIQSRRNNLPPVDKSGKLVNLDIPDSSGLAEITHFVFFKKTNTFGLEYNFYGPKVNKLGKYVENKFSQEIGQLNFKPILNYDIDKMLEKVEEISRLEIEVDRNALNVMEERNFSLASAFRSLAESTTCTTISLCLKKDNSTRMKGFFDFPREFKEDIKGLLSTQEFRDNTSKLKIKGKKTVEKSCTEVDFLVDKFILKKDIKYKTEGKNRIIDKNEMIEAIKKSYKEIEAHIQVVD